MSELTRIGYVNIFVSDFERALDFYERCLGLEATTRDEQFGYASFRTQGAGFAFARTDDAGLTGRHTGIGWVVDDLPATYEALVAKGVTFDMPPSRQPWGGFMAMFRDPDGNVFYLDQVEHQEAGA